MQTFYNIIYLPTYTINLISLFVSKPLLRSFGELWNDKKYKEFRTIIIKMFFILFLVTLVVEIACFFIGIPILSMLYGVNLDVYKMELLILIASGFFYAMSSLIFYLLGAMRGQGKVMISYGIAAIFAFFIPGFLVQTYGMMGAALSNLGINILLFIILIILLIGDYKKKVK